MPASLCLLRSVLQPPAIKAFVDKALGASDEDLATLLEGYTWEFEKVMRLNASPAYLCEAPAFSA